MSDEPGRGRQPERPRPHPHHDFVQPARRVAYEVIAAVRESDAYANLLLPTRIKRAALNTADAALATELTYGTLRMQGFYDRVIAEAAGRPVSAIDPAILDVLRLGTHQLLATRVATHAAVNESVELARQVGSPTPRERMIASRSNTRTRCGSSARSASPCGSRAAKPNSKTC